ncbi:MAG: hypothetical protein JXR94_08195 [Candidatus Hydrogenedentes bacterium]|nr:hypothetical protein [Candidatus Hydrogenedentota bacterium]
MAAYVTVVLTVDTLAARDSRFVLDWDMFRWRLAWGFDFFKFTLWLVIPFTLCLRRMDWGALGVRRWRRVDLYILCGMAVVACLAVLSIRLFPSLGATYQGLGRASWALKRQQAAHYLAWTASWLVGWEFMHRYFLLRPLQARWPRFGWLVVPLAEGVYHLQKPLLEAAGMVALSLFLTPWAMRRNNVALPFVAHLLFELGLLAYLLFA